MVTMLDVEFPEVTTVRPDGAYRLEAGTVAWDSRFFGIVIRMVWREDEAPHFHARYGEFVASVDIATGRFTTRRFPGRALLLVGEWRERHRDELLENWERMRRHEQPIAIEPLA
jgi:hypothetical protein